MVEIFHVFFILTTCHLEGLVEKFRENNKLAKGSFFISRFSFIGERTPEAGLPRGNLFQKRKNFFRFCLPLKTQQKQEEVVGTFVTPST